VDFEYEYDPNTSNISEMAYAHRGDSNAVGFTYDGLDRLAVAEYNITDDSNEAFTIGDLGNRDSVNPPQRANNMRNWIANRPISSGRGYWNASEKMQEKVKMSNYNRWLSLVCCILPPHTPKSLRYPRKPAPDQLTMVKTQSLFDFQ
jgi:hypothetical protein